ncbi:hypothetical protein [Dyadobacter sp. CY326]|uniref:hypothetical protein n=1 Tax=Dyadobacter sp. CY326 TaxID=2907300 RepID=UPI001F47AE6E|nr:hypothetical protein [Dyadobacter sp. CY326]MCE7066650.1 hypothetical protein [Dyadobacter sp. CY326]
METNILSHQQTYAQPSFLKRISWSAVFAGVLIALVVQMLLSLLGLGVGLSTIDAVEEQNPAAGLGMGTAIWYIISSLVSLFIGGWIAGRLASAPRTFDGIIHGVLTWSLVTLLTIYFLTTTVGSIIGGAGRMLGGLVKSAGSAVASAAPGAADKVQEQLQASGINLDDLKGQVTQVLRQTGDPALSPDALGNKAENAVDQAKSTGTNAASNPQATDEMASGLFKKLFKEGQSTISQVDRQDAVNVVMKQTGKSQAESEQIVNNWISTYNQAKVKIDQAKEQAEVKGRQAADDAASAASKAAIFGFIGLVIGVAAAGFGAKKGTESKDEDSKYDRPVHATV